MENKMSDDTVNIEFELESDHAYALAQFVKRLSWAEVRACAVNDDETYVMRIAIGVLQDALSEAGYRPR